MALRYFSSLPSVAFCESVHQGFLCLSRNEIYKVCGFNSKLASTASIQMDVYPTRMPTSEPFIVILCGRNLLSPDVES